MLRFATVLVLLLHAAPAFGQAPAPLPAQLDYSRAPTCEDVSNFRNLVAARLSGHDPFTNDASRRIEVKLHRRGPSNFEAVVLLFDATGRHPETASAPNCTALVDEVAGIVGVWLMPLLLPRRLSPSPAQDPPRPEPAPPLPEARPDPPKSNDAPPPIIAPVALPERARFVPRLGVGARADFGPAAGALFGVTMEGGFQRREWGWGGWSLMGAFRWAPQQVGIGPPASVAAADVSASLVAGSFAGCVYRAWPVTLAGCVVGELGAIQQSATGTSPYAGLHQSALFVGGGVGARVEFPLSARLYAQMATDVVGVGKLAGSTNTVVNVNARSIGGAAGGLGAGLGVSF